MIPQERGLEGISTYFIFYLPIIVLMENNSYMSFLGGKAKWFLNSKNYINPSLVYLGVLTPILILVLLLVASFIHSFSLMHSFTQLLVVHTFRWDFTPFILPPTHLSSFMSWLGKGKQTVEEKPWYCWL
jgi:hypothetical protein